MLTRPHLALLNRVRSCALHDRSSSRLWQGTRRLSKQMSLCYSYLYQLWGQSVLSAGFRRTLLFLLVGIWLGQSAVATVPMPMAGGDMAAEEQHQLSSDPADFAAQPEGSHHGGTRCSEQHCSGGHNCIDGHCTPVAAISSETVALQYVGALLSLEFGDRPISTSPSFFRPPIIG